MSNMSDKKNPSGLVPQMQEHDRVEIVNLEKLMRDSYIDYAMSVMPNTSRHVAASTMKNLINKENWTGAVINRPSLIICTQNSGLAPDNRQQMEALYSCLQYEELLTCGHFIHMERAEWFNEILRQFLIRLQNER